MYFCIWVLYWRLLGPSCMWWDAELYNAPQCLDILEMQCTIFASVKCSMQVFVHIYTFVFLIYFHLYLYLCTVCRSSRVLKALGGRPPAQYGSERGLPVSVHWTRKPRKYENPENQENTKTRKPRKYENPKTKKIWKPWKYENKTQNSHKIRLYTCIKFKTQMSPLRRIRVTPTCVWYKYK